MKKAMMFAMLTVLGAMFLLPAAAQAQSGWYTCTVVSVGPAIDPNTVYVRLTDDGGAFTTTWFTPIAGMDNKMLAIALTAMSGVEMKVRVFLSGTTHGSRINAMYLEQH